jgi:hypothetical protein
MPAILVMRQSTGIPVLMAVKDPSNIVAYPDFSSWTTIHRFAVSSALCSSTKDMKSAAKRKTAYKL